MRAAERDRRQVLVQITLPHPPSAKPSTMIVLDLLTRGSAIRHRFPELNIPSARL